MECLLIKCWKDIDNLVKNKRWSKYNLISWCGSWENVCVVLLGFIFDWMIKCCVCFLVNSMVYLLWWMFFIFSENYFILNYWFKYFIKCFIFSFNLWLNFLKCLIIKRKWIVFCGILIENGILCEIKCFFVLKFVIEMVMLYVLLL